MEGSPLEEHDLTERARRGDVAAYEALVRLHQQAAFRTAYSILGDAGEAEDAAQEGFVKAFYALERFRAGAPFAPWLLRIVANEARNRRRAAGRRYFLHERAGRLELTRPQPPTPETSMLRTESDAELIAALNDLSEMDRMVITYRYFLELSEAETALALDCAPGTVKSRLHRALRRLRERLAGSALEATGDD
jgi:RNA polymerase sigma-70 factor (ECF subfamily)